MHFHVSATSGVLGRDRFNDWLLPLARSLRTSASSAIRSLGSFPQLAFPENEGSSGRAGWHDVAEGTLLRMIAANKCNFHSSVGIRENALLILSRPHFCAGGAKKGVARPDVFAI